MNAQVPLPDRDGVTLETSFSGPAVRRSTRLGAIERSAPVAVGTAVARRGPDGATRPLGVGAVPDAVLHGQVVLALRSWHPQADVRARRPT